MQNTKISAPTFLLLLVLVFLVYDSVAGCAHGISGTCMHFRKCNGHAVGYISGGRALCPGTPDEIMFVLHNKKYEK
jgi:hypothetical protein